MFIAYSLSYYLNKFTYLNTFKSKLVPRCLDDWGPTVVVVIMKCFIYDMITGCWLMSIPSSVLLTRSPRGYRWGCDCHSEDMWVVITFRWHHMVTHHALMYWLVNQSSWMMISESYCNVIPQSIVIIIRWHYTCTDLHQLLLDNINTNDTLFEITKIGLYSDPAADGSGYQVDEISLSSDIRTLSQVRCY